MSEALSSQPQVLYLISPTVTNQQLNKLFAASWPQHNWRDFQPLLSRSLTYICAYQAEQLIGFINLAWDGGLHAFVLDTTVHPELRRRGIGRHLVKQVVAIAHKQRVEWVHVDFDKSLRDFYLECGFRLTEAGLIDVGAIGCA